MVVSLETEKRRSMNIECYICHEDIRVPVRFTCFPCKNEPGQPSCNSITRVCLLCAREYLQLNKKRSERTFSRKCLTCPATVRCSELCAINSYEKDFFMMSHDPKNNYPCFYETDGCDFQGSQNNLDHHIQSECRFRIISCRYCWAYYPATNEKTHVSQCPNYFQCLYCAEHVPVSEEKEHFLKIHKQRQCAYCQRYIGSHEYDKHACECPERPHECVSCHLPIPRRRMYDHLIEDIVSCEQTIRHHTNAISVLSDKMSRILKESQKYR